MEGPAEEAVAGEAAVNRVRTVVALLTVPLAAQEPPPRQLLGIEMPCGRAVEPLNMQAR